MSSEIRSSDHFPFWGSYIFRMFFPVLSTQGCNFYSFKQCLDLGPHFGLSAVQAISRK
jgi:hypothetical protein